MNSTHIGLLVFAGTFGASMLAIQARRRVPLQHIEQESDTVLKLVLALISTLTALVLSLLISTGYSAYQQQRVEIQDLGNAIFKLDRALAHLGPEAAGSRVQLQQLLRDAIDTVWSGAPATSEAKASVQQQGEDLFDVVAAVPAGNNLQHLAQERAVAMLESMSTDWHLLLVQQGGNLSTPILWVLTCWLFALFFGFGLFTKFNATVAVGLLVGSASVAGAIFLIVDLNQPYRGWMQIPKSILTTVLAQIGH